MSAVLHKARHYLVKGMHSRAHKLLISQAPRFKKHYEYLYLSGIAAFGMGNIDSAYEYFNTAVSIASPAQSHDAKLYLAAIALASRNVRKAAEHWLSMSNEQKGNQYAARGLRYLQHLNDDSHERIADMARNPSKYKIVPELSYPLQKLHKTIKMLAIFIGSAVLVYGVYFIATKSMNWYKKRSAASEREAIVSSLVANARSKTEATVRGDTYPRYVVLSPNAIRGLLKNVERNFILYNDNRARVDINTILHSNALAADKTKAVLLAGYLRKIDFGSNVAWFAYSQVRAEAWQYHKTTVRWRGTITQVATKGAARTGNFLVGFYGNNKNLEGVVPANIPNFIELNTGDEVEILGMVILDAPSISRESSEVAQSFSLNVKAIRYLRANER